MPKLIHLLFKLLIWSAVFPALGQLKTLQPIFINYQKEQGLQDNWVRNIVQDQDGYLWFLTGEGLHRYDGYTFTVYRNNPLDNTSIPANFVRTMTVDLDNEIWLGHQHGISRLDRKTNSFVNYSASNPTASLGLPGNNVKSICADKVGNLWVGMHDQGLVRIDKDRKNFERINQEAGTPFAFQLQDIRNIFCDSKNRLWISSRVNGIALVQYEEKKVTYFTKPTLTTNVIDCFHEDSKGRIWIGTLAGGLLQFDEAKGQFIPHFYDTQTQRSAIEGIVSIQEDPEGNIWFSNENHGLFIYNPETKQYKIIPYIKYLKNGLPHNSIPSLFRDKDGNMWLGTFAGGLSYYPFPNNNLGYFFQIPGEPRSLSENKVLCFLEDKSKNIWVGTDQGGVTIYRSDGSIKFINDKPGSQPRLSANVVTALYQDRKGKIWIGTYNKGFQVYDPESGIIKSYETLYLEDQVALHGVSVICFEEEANGDIWMGTNGLGLLYYNIKTGNIKRIKTQNRPGTLSDDFIFSITRDRQHQLWFNTNNGLDLLVDKDKELFKSFKNIPGISSSLSGNSVFTSYMDTKHRFWIGTDNGLNLLNPLDSTFTSYQENINFPASKVMAIKEDQKGNLWISSTNGLINFFPETGKYIVYFISDGTQSNQFAANAGYKTSDGHLLFGGSNGFNYFDPLKVKTKTTSLPLHFYVGTNEENETRRLQNKQSLSLNYDQNNLSFSFMALDLNNAKNLNYSYTLRGFENTWHKSNTKTHTSYTNLPPGNYTFILKVHNPSTADHEEYQYYIAIKTPFWKEWYFFALIIAAILVSFYFILKIINSIHNRRRKYLEDKVQERTRQLSEQKNKVESLYKQINESLDAAKNIQEALLPGEDKLNGLFADHFVIYRPLNKVSGDLYWVHQKSGLIYVALLDCTGHGVPGAILSMIANDKLNEIIRNHDILQASDMIRLLKEAYDAQNKDSHQFANSMDIGFCIIDKQHKRIQFAGSKIPLYVGQGDELKIYKGETYSIGYINPRKAFEFNNYVIALEENTILYLATDGYSDQIGGEHNDKLLTGRLKERLMEGYKRKCFVQKENLENFLEEWKGNNPQIDDISVLGIRI